MTAYLTEIVVALQDAAKQRIYTPYSWHKFVWKYFTNVKSRNFIFRVDKIDNAFRIYAVSTEPPSDCCDIGIIRTKEIPESFLNRKNYVFKIRLNPVRTHIVRDEKTGLRKKNGIRRVVSEGDLPVWINEKFLKNGMRIIHDSDMGLETEISPITGCFLSKNNGNSSKILSVDVSGFIEIENRELFKKAFLEGIGHAKAFGFGMLILK